LIVGIAGFVLIAVGATFAKLGFLMAGISILFIGVLLVAAYAFVMGKSPPV